MLKFVIDEDMPRSTSRALNGKGHKALDVRDHGLRGKSDQQVYEFAHQEEAIILTGDLGFGNIMRFPIGSHFGIFVVHFPNEVSASELNN
jgi:predicted nuclease of predicted toxin-antitoxin system